MITKTRRLILEPHERDPDWKPKPKVDVVTLATINEALGTRYAAKDPQQVVDDLQISILAEIPYGSGKMPLFDAEAFRHILELRGKSVGTEVGTDIAAAELIAKMQAELDILRNEVNKLKGEQ